MHANTDLVVGAGGSGNWERCLLSVPEVVAILAEDQMPIVEAFDHVSWRLIWMIQVVKTLGHNLNHDHPKSMASWLLISLMQEARSA